MPVDLLPAEPVALICAVTADAEDTLVQAEERLASCIGPVRLRSGSYLFDEYTTYYQEEMGSGLIKRLTCFRERIDPALLPEIKLRTMELEKEMARRRGGRFLRRANIDPGLVSIESLVLATTKCRGHRICIGTGLYAEVTLLYQKGRYSPLPWTYPDYRSEEVQRFLLEVRGRLMQERRPPQA